MKKGKESPKSNKKKTPGLNSLTDVERALSEHKDSTSAVSMVFLQRETSDCARPFHWKFNWFVLTLFNSPDGNSGGAAGEADGGFL